MDKRIGRISDSGPEWPELTISGKPYDKPPTQYRNIGPGLFVVLDTFPATDQYGAPLFDVEAAIAELKLKTSAVPPADLLPEVRAEVQADAATPKVKR